MRRTTPLLAALALTASIARAQETQVAAESAAPVAEASEQAASASEADAQEQDAPAGDAPVEMLSESELEELGFAATAQETIDKELKIYGFADATFSAALMKKSNVWRSVFNRYPTFWVGNFNVYLSKNLSEHFRTMGEVRFMLLPNGNIVPPNSPLVSDTIVLDYNDFNRPTRWGGIEIERLYLEWSPASFLVVRMGMFLTPYGIWNVDHGTPTFITTGKPYVIGNQLFPERQTGIELFGRVEKDRSVFGYHLTLSNGTGPVAEYRDLDENKAIGGRLYWQYRKVSEVRVGASGYYGRDTRSSFSYTVNEEVTHIIPLEKITAQYDALAFAADVVWRYAGWHVQSEWICQQIHYTDKGRGRDTNALTGQTVFPVDDFAWGVYLLIAHRFSWLGITPNVKLQYFDQIDPLSKTVTELTGLTFGLNFNPVDEVVFKIAYFEAHFPNGHLASEKPLRLGQTQVAWAF